MGYDPVSGDEDVADISRYSREENMVDWVIRAQAGESRALGVEDDEVGGGAGLYAFACETEGPRANNRGRPSEMDR